MGLVVIDYITCDASNVKIFRAKNICKIPRKNLKEIRRKKFRYLSLECNTVLQEEFIRCHPFYKASDIHRKDVIIRLSSSWK